MAADSEKQRRMMCADLARAEKGKGTRTGMSVQQLRDYCESDVRAKGGGKGKK